MLPSLEKIKENINQLERESQSIIGEVQLKNTLLKSINDSMAENRQKEICLQEIYMLACVQFPRLRKQMSGSGLSIEDVQELEKWIGRTKSLSGLQDIVNALKELNKYFPEDIKSNLYALVQRIIIGGAFGSKRRTFRKS